MILDAYFYGDPAKVLEAKQERQQKFKNSCFGCVNLRSIEFGGDVVVACSLKRAKALRKCEFYKQTKGTL